MDEKPGDEKYIFRIINSKYISLPFIYIFTMFGVRFLCHVERHMICQQSALGEKMSYVGFSGEVTKNSLRLAGFLARWRLPRSDFFL